VAVLSSLAIALLSVVASLTAFWVVRTSLLGDLQRAVQEDVQKVAALYQGGGAGAAGATLAGPTGGVIVQLYDASGQLLASSNPTFEALDAAIAPDVVRMAVRGSRDWRGVLAGYAVQASLAPFSFGVAAVIADTAFVGQALGQLARALLFTATLLVLISALIGYLVAALAIRPITQLAVRAAELGPGRLHPIPYRGPSDEVGQLSFVLNDLIERLKQSMDAQRSFLAETSHELRTPLTSLQGFLERAFRRASPEVQHDLTDARRIVKTMSHLIEDLLQLSRGQLVQELTPYLVDPYLEVLVPIAEEFSGVGLSGESGQMLLGDPEKLRQLVRNLTANAVRSAREPDRVELRLERSGTHLVVSVCDQGPGISEDLLPHIFEKFYRGGGGGAGLGLAIAQQIARLHKGEIEVESEPGNTVFRVALPLIELPE
jgi:signal transduction histidine kinase